MMKLGVVEPYEVSYSDLMSLSSDNLDIKSEQVRGIMVALGPTGNGLLTITKLPSEASILRSNLLSHAHSLALLPTQHRNPILKEHGLGSDVPLKKPDRLVSSFAMQLKYGQKSFGVRNPNPHNPGMCENGVNDFENLGDTFKELGFIMMDLGLLLARICDRALGTQVLEQTLLESCSAKGRLIHYHSLLDNLTMEENLRKNGSLKNAEPTHKSEIGSQLWQDWHYDYGIFTVLTAPFFTASPVEEKIQGNEIPTPSGHSYLQILDRNKKGVFHVKACPNSFIIQVGESADVLSKGRLRSTLHSVCRPRNMENLGRETFVVFLQPAWAKTFSIEDYPMENKCTEQDCDELNREINRIVPPLTSRLKDGMTFAEFSRETTRKYYGGNGLQSNR